ncbi:PC4/YdbC family ssDNA-binding protein [Paraburkholderia nemoris]|uniref:hypothetical protein n=1 Tax=Paraburkholderia nemoris TaxID=2793076 RepID=UPI0038B9EBA3
MSGTLQPGAPLAEIQKNAYERIRISVDFYKGREYIALRVLHVNSEGDYQPRQNGVILIKPSLAQQLVRGIELAARAADPTGVN